MTLVLQARNIWSKLRVQHLSRDRVKHVISSLKGRHRAKSVVNALSETIEISILVVLTSVSIETIICSIFIKHSFNSLRLLNAYTLADRIGEKETSAKKSSLITGWL